MSAEDARSEIEVMATIIFISPFQGSGNVYGR
jgi:hypothetical protein